MPRKPIVCQDTAHCRAQKVLSRRKYAFQRRVETATEVLRNTKFMHCKVYDFLENAKVGFRKTVTRPCGAKDLSSYSLYLLGLNVFGKRKIKYLICVTGFPLYNARKKTLTIVEISLSQSCHVYRNEDFVFRDILNNKMQS